MKWTQSNTFRGFVVAVLSVLVVVNATERDWTWVVVGGVLLVLNAASLYRQLTTGPGAGALFPSAAARLVPGGVDVRLSALLEQPAVRAAWSSAPAVWHQVSYLEDEEDLALEASDVADYVWLSTDDSAYAPWHWSVAVGDELKPLLDLDVEPDGDAIIATLSAHPAVVEVDHVDREEYAVVLRSPMTLEDMAVLAVRGLVAHHLDAVRRMRARPESP